MAHEKEREILEKFYRHVNDKNGKLTVTWDDVETFLSTLPEEKEEKRCKEFIVGEGVNDVLNFIDEATSDCMIMKDLNKPNERYVFDRPIKMTIEV